MENGITIKTPEEIEKMREIGKLAGELLTFIEPYVKPGVTTLELDNLMADYIENTQHVVSACLGYEGYPKYTCISVNEVVCHGIPSAAHKIRNGDIVNIDVTLIKDGYHGDTSKMFLVGDVPIRNVKLCKCAQHSMYEAIKQMAPGRNLTLVGDVIQKIADKEGFSIVREYCGHGIGTGFHEPPQVLHYKNHNNLLLSEGMVFTIEPMINAGTWKTKVNKSNGWTVTTSDKQPSAQYEHTIVITKDGCEILTHRPDDEIEKVIHVL